MRITFVLPYAGLQGGVRVVSIYADRLRKRGHRVTVISSPLQTRLRSRAKALALRLRGVPVNTESSYLEGLGLDHRVLDRPRDVTDADVPDADVVVATYYTTAYGVQRLSPAKGAKAIFIQNYEVPEGTINPRLDATWRMPMHKITISRWLVDLARSRFGDESVSHVPNSVDTRQFNALPRGKNRIPTVGLLYSTFALKGCRTSLDAVKRIAAALPELRVVSFGAERPDFRLPLPRFTQFHFRPAQDELRNLYALCDVWLCGSNVEGFHLPPLEAMACRCPVVSTRVGGPLDTIEEGVNGHLVDVKDSRALAERTLDILKAPEVDWRSMSDAAYRTATRFTWDDATDLFENALGVATERTWRSDWQPTVTANFEVREKLSTMSSNPRQRP
jgi:glycosyltransferase involved in cell wall biosynthesis